MDVLTDQPGPGLAGGQYGAGQDRAYGCHQMLVRLAGRAPDDLMTRSRDWLANGEFGQLARSVAYWAVSQDAVLAETDKVLLSGMLTDTGADASGLSELAVDDDDPYPPYGFAAEIPPDLGGGSGGTPGPLARAGAPADQAAVQAVAAERGALGLWRAWRFPDDGAPWPPPKRVFVIETAGGDETGLAARMARRMTEAGEADPQVEVCRSGSPVPIYTELARSCGELLWAAEPAADIQLAQVFDGTDADAGPSFSPDHPELGADEADKVAGYLYGCEPLLMTAGLMDDVLDSSLVYSVPMSFRTDGHWIWNEASAYYAEEHQLAPDTGLLEHLRSNGYAPPAVTAVGLYRALLALQGARSDELLWMLGAEAGESDMDHAGQELGDL